MEQALYKELVAHFGNQHKTAEALGCSQPAVFKWISGKSYMGAAIAVKAELKTEGKFRAVELCPALANLGNEKGVNHARQENC